MDNPAVTETVVKSAPKRRRRWVAPLLFVISLSAAILLPPFVMLVLTSYTR